MVEPVRKEDKTDISKKVEELLLGIFLLIERVLTTFCNFLLRPSLVAREIADNEPLSDAFPKRYARPVTYFFATFAVMLGGFILLFKTMPDAQDMEKKNPFIALFIKASQDAKITGIIIVLLPFILAVGLHSYTFYWSNRKKHPQITFRNSLYMSSYFSGNVALVYILLLPLMPLFKGEYWWSMSMLTKVWIGALSIIGWGALFRFLYSYLVFVRYLCNCRWWSAVGMYLKGLFFFFVFYYLILAWLAPLAFSLME